MSSRLRKLFYPVLRLAVAGVIFAVLAGIMNFGETLAVLGASEPSLVAAAMVLFGVGQVLSCVRWRLTLSQIIAAPPRVLMLLRLYLIGMFVNLGLPTMTGGDIVRAELLRRFGGGRGGAYASIFADRLVGVLAVVLVAIGAIALAGDRIDGQSRHLVLVALLGLTCALVVFVLVFSWSRARLRWPALGTFFEALRLLRRRPRVLALSLAIAISVQVIGVIVPIVLLAWAMSIAIPVAVHFALIPIIVLAALVPVAPNGLGVREAAFVVLYGQFGVGPEPAFALGLSWSIVLTIYGLFGGLALAFGDPSVRSGALGGARQKQDCHGATTQHRSDGVVLGALRRSWPWR
ncbi:hypothetical protein DEA8626_00120 [Defluviimonas aquaemixtae]|uniref:Flippase-like domain-containing protein n=1 Tax=Albidovulum aquaemixtae TaxID=1542388 RepID=A0A2R8B235_9RHOB|nr:lysylphosphatidylglycerol synthase transmembrane domain-containing protein [Defluviimonas aquaemixtae]SPH16610.1 hypothetical protein DEA8626_00120 [Defluviimonas aquaemixtae]